MDATQLEPPPIGPTTEARIQAAFADKALLSAEETGALLGIDAKSVTALVEVGALRAVRRGGGTIRAYTEGDIRFYLTDSAAPAREPRPKVPVPSPGRVVPFSQRKASRPGR